MFEVVQNSVRGRGRCCSREIDKATADFGWPFSDPRFRPCVCGNRRWLGWWRRRQGMVVAGWFRGPVHTRPAIQHSSGVKGLGYWHLM